MSMLLTGLQIRAARAMLRWCLPQLAEKAGTSVSTLRRIEARDGLPNTSPEVLHRIFQCFTAEGLTFIPEDGSPEGPGVRWGSYAGRVASSD